MPRRENSRRWLVSPRKRSSKRRSTASNSFLAMGRPSLKVRGRKKSYRRAFLGMLSPGSPVWLWDYLEGEFFLAEQSHLPLGHLVNRILTYPRDGTGAGEEVPDFFPVVGWDSDYGHGA